METLKSINTTVTIGSHMNCNTSPGSPTVTNDLNRPPPAYHQVVGPQSAEPFSGAINVNSLPGISHHIRIPPEIIDPRDVLQIAVRQFSENNHNSNNNFNSRSDTNSNSQYHSQNQPSASGNDKLPSYDECFGDRDRNCVFEIQEQPINHFRSVVNGSTRSAQNVDNSAEILSEELTTALPSSKVDLIQYLNKTNENNAPLNKDRSAQNKTEPRNEEHRSYLQDQKKELHQVSQKNTIAQSTALFYASSSKDLHNCDAEYPKKGEINQTSLSSEQDKTNVPASQDSYHKVCNKKADATRDQTIETQTLFASNKEIADPNSEESNHQESTNETSDTIDQTYMHSNHKDCSDKVVDNTVYSQSPKTDELPSVEETTDNATKNGDNAIASNEADDKMKSICLQK